MKCYSIKLPGVLRDYILAKDIRPLLPRSMRKLDKIRSAYIDLQLFPGISYENVIRNEYLSVYGFGLTMLANQQTTHSRRLGKSAMLVLYNHRRFHLDKAEGDKSNDVWTGQNYELVVAYPQSFVLRETGSNNLFGIGLDGKLKSETII